MRIVRKAPEPEPETEARRTLTDLFVGDGRAWPSLRDGVRQADGFWRKGRLSMGEQTAGGQVQDGVFHIS